MLALLGSLSAAPAAYAADQASSADDGLYREIIFDATVRAGEHRAWLAECPDDFPYLDRHTGAAGRVVGQGVFVQVSGDYVEVQEELGGAARQRVQIEDGTTRVRANGGGIVNWTDRLGRPIDRQVRIEMVCTNDLARAWQG